MNPSVPGCRSHSSPTPTTSPPPCCFKLLGFYRGSRATGGRFAKSLTEMGSPTGGGAPSPSAAGLIGSDLASGEKQGYRYVLSEKPGGYVIIATPITYGTSGSRSFYSDETMIIHENYGAEPATASSPEMGATKK